MNMYKYMYNIYDDFCSKLQIKIFLLTKLIKVYIFSDQSIHLNLIDSFYGNSKK